MNHDEKISTATWEYREMLKPKYKINDVIVFNSKQYIIFSAKYFSSLGWLYYICDGIGDLRDDKTWCIKEEEIDYRLE